eukprot:m.39488 g.39488  ORF g.39488 m.39488 type:complete len:51 (-) comp10290_c0_seq2:80-232(-)
MVITHIGARHSFLLLRLILKTFYSASVEMSKRLCKIQSKHPFNTKPCLDV